MDQNNLTKDLIVLNVLKKFNDRSLIGINKYNTTLDDNKLELKEWLQHLQEELMDACNYIEKIINEIN